MVKVHGDHRPQKGGLISRAYINQYMSNEKSLGWLGYIGDYTTQLYRDYNKTTIRIPINYPGFPMERIGGCFFFVAHMVVLYEIFRFYLGANDDSNGRMVSSNI